MQIKVESSKYLSALEATLTRIVFDRSSGESFSFEDLFYPLEIDEGKYAFQSYAEQMELARKLVGSNSVSSNALGMSILEKIQQYQRRNNSPTLPPVHSTSRTSAHASKQDDSDNKAIRNQILAKLKSQNITGDGVTVSSEAEESSSEDLLQVEPKYDHSSLITLEIVAF